MSTSILIDSATSTDAGTDVLLHATGIDKSFPGVQALHAVELEIRVGEVHGLAGENGSGKSTLSKILAGRYQPDAGQLLYRGEAVRFRSPVDALERGIALVSQEVLVHPHLTVAENMFLGQQIGRPRHLVRWTEMCRRAGEQLARLELDLDPTRELRTYPLHLQHMVAIAKMVSRQPRLLILDEPTSSLDDQETEALIRLIHRLRSEDISILYVTHRLREYFQVADRLTVLRDGNLIGCSSMTGLDEDRIVAQMVGRELDLTRRALPVERSEHPVLRVDGLGVGTKLHDIDLDVFGGEVVGIAGQAGAGRSTLARALFGLIRSTGAVTLNGSLLRLTSPAAAIGAGIGYVPEDRKREGLVMSMSVAENVTMTTWARLSRAGALMRYRINDTADRAISSLGIRTASRDTLVGNLSGGNQQKIVVAKWLARNPALMILDEPTRGVDVGAKQEIYDLIEEMKATGMAVLVISSDLPELLRLSDRIVVLERGRAVGELDGRTATEEAVTTLALGLQTPPDHPHEVQT